MSTMKVDVSFFEDMTVKTLDNGLETGEKLVHVFTDDPLNVLRLDLIEGENGKLFLTPRTADILSNHYGYDKLKGVDGYENFSSVLIKTKTRGMEKLMATHGVVMLAQNIVNSGWNYNDLNFKEGIPGAISILLAPFFSLPGFHESYKEYLADPDLNVKIIKDEAEIKKFNDELMKNFNIKATENETPETYSENEVFYLLAMQVMCFRRQFVEADHVEEFRKKTSSAICRILAAEELINRDWCQTISDKILMKIHTYWNKYPKLQATIFQHILASTKIPICVYVAELFKKVILSNFILVYRFVTTDEKTVLHFEPLIMKETIRWFPIFLRFYGQYGDHWPYFILFDRLNEEVNMRKFPHLVSAALAYNMVYECPIQDFKEHDNAMIEPYTKLAMQKPILETGSTTTCYQRVDKIFKAIAKYKYSIGTDYSAKLCNDIF